MRTIKLKHDMLGRYDDVSPFLVESGTLDLKVELPNMSGEFYLVTELNGKSGGAKQISKGGTVTLAGLEAGELKAEVKQYLRGNLIETYKVEPLLLKAVDKELSAMPEIALLTAECKALRGKLEEQANALTQVNERAEVTETRNHRRDAAFLAFAYAEYQNDLQLNAKSLPLDEFAAALGYDLGSFTEEEIEEIKTLKEKL